MASSNLLTQILHDLIHRLFIGRVEGRDLEI
jgi:hypothetical protein